MSWPAIRRLSGMQVLRRLRYHLNHQSLLRRFELYRDERQAIKNRAVGSVEIGHPALTVFNLDLHVAVNKDLSQGLKQIDVEVKTWSLSMHNHLITGRRPIPDPVAIVNALTWRDLTTTRVQAFQKRYRRFLESFDGFMVTYPPAFAQLFEGLNRPTLVVAATRYEAPYTTVSERWTQLDKFLERGVGDGSILMIANNRADADYFAYFTNVAIPVVPSLCMRGGDRWKGGGGRRVIIGRVPELIEKIESATDRRFVSVSRLGSPYSWGDLLQCEEVCVLPQNVSTMTLFELATAGVPVAVPSRRFMKLLVANYPGLLGELTFAQIERRSTANLADSDPTNWSSDSYLEWWLNRADFYDHELMPNVRVFDSFAELVDSGSSFEESPDQYWDKILERNRRILEMRTALAVKFRCLLRA